jgi:hypothetical protein
LFAQEAHGPQRRARLEREELPALRRLTDNGVGDLLPLSTTRSARRRISPSLRSGIGA